MAGLGKPQLIVALHDVTPVHAARLDRAEALLRTLGIGEATYLLVPRFHGVPSDEDATFIRWCRSSRPFRIHWMLHGYLHRESRDGIGATAQDPRGAWWKRRLLTGGEGEFLALQGEALRERLMQGRDVFRRCLDADPDGLVPPAWLAHPSLAAALRDLGFDYTEDHHRLYQLRQAHTLQSPVITWATRTFARRVGSLVVCPALATLWQPRPLIRTAMHPLDFDYPATVASLTRLLRALLREREPISVHGAFMSSGLP